MCVAKEKAKEKEKTARQRPQTQKRLKALTQTPQAKKKAKGRRKELRQRPEAKEKAKTARTVGAITCRTINRKGGVLMYQLSTKSLIIRHKFTVLPVPEGVIRMLDDTVKADFEKRKLTKTTEPVPANSP